MNACNAAPAPVMAAAIDKEEARRAWRERFNNRAPQERKPAKVEVKAAADGVTEILIYEEIGYWGVTASEFIAALAAVTTPAVTVRINSPGGDVFDGIAIYNAIKQYKGDVTCSVEGLAASAASMIALAGKTMIMSDTALFMAHCAWSIAVGSSADMLEMAGILQKIDGQLAGIYAAKTGKPAPEMLAMMEGDGKNDGTWFTADEAKAYGFCDEVIGAPDEPAPDELLAAATSELLAAANSRIVQAMKRRLAIAERDD